MSIDFYWGSGSPYAWRVQLALALKGIEYNSHLLSFSAKEHKTPDFLKLNPRGRVPVLVHDGIPIRESLAILVYLDKIRPEVPLLGESPRESAEVWRIILEHQGDFGAASRDSLTPLLFGRPIANQSAFDASIEATLAELSKLDTEIQGRKWLAGENMTAADIFVYPSLRFLERVLAKDAVKAMNLPIANWRDRTPSLSRWMQRFEALPGVLECDPPHWSEPS